AYAPAPGPTYATVTPAPVMQIAAPVVAVNIAPAVTPSIAPTRPAAPAAPSIDLEKLLIAIVAEKTGYPADMLGGHMELEADLGIDSIKRVEILSAMRERAPGLREVKPTELAALRTLGQIVDYMRAHGGSASAVVASPSSSNGHAPAASAVATGPAI